MAGEASSAITRARGQRAASAAAPRPVPQPRSSTVSGTKATHSRRRTMSSRRRAASTADAS